MYGTLSVSCEARRARPKGNLVEPFGSLRLSVSNKKAKFFFSRTMYESPFPPFRWFPYVGCSEKWSSAQAIVGKVASSRRQLCLMLSAGIDSKHLLSIHLHLWQQPASQRASQTERGRAATLFMGKAVKINFPLVGSWGRDVWRFEDMGQPRWKISGVCWICVSGRIWVWRS